MLLSFFPFPQDLSTQILDNTVLDFSFRRMRQKNGGEKKFKASYRTINKVISDPDTQRTQETQQVASAH
jgi:hypothetical protein